MKLLKVDNNKDAKFNLIKDVKYSPARLKDPKNNYLFLCEGDSAKNFIDTMINGKNDNYGILILQGKPINIRKKPIK
jgi:DNA gyrase/topoisomerase IV subunit B